jgi:serine protease Do
VIVKILPKGAWIHRGLKIGDIIIEANQEPVSAPEDLKIIISNHSKQKRKSILLLISRMGQKTFLSMPLDDKKDK